MQVNFDLYAHVLSNKDTLAAMIMGEFGAYDARQQHKKP